MEKSNDNIVQPVFIKTLRYLVKGVSVMGADETEDFLKKRKEIERAGKERL